MRKVLTNSVSGSGFNVDSTHWFDTITQKINILKKIDDYLSKNLSIQASDKYEKESSNLLVFTIIVSLATMLTAILSYSISANISFSVKEISIGIKQFLDYLNR